MSFRVVLPSNSSMRLYPQNTLADFRVRLEKPIVLPMPYEVALDEIIYPKRSNDFAAGETWIRILYHDRESKKKKNRTLIDEVKIGCSSASGYSVLAWTINEALQTFNWVLTFNYKGIFKFVQTSKWLKTSLVLHPKLAKSLGFIRKTRVVLIDKFEVKALHQSPLFYHLSQMFIYADIVAHQHVGDALVPLLRICINEKGDDELRSEKYIRPYYVPVVRQRIEEVHIQVKTHTADPYPFPSGAPLICKLHFRPKQ